MARLAIRQRNGDAIFRIGVVEPCKAIQTDWRNFSGSESRDRTGGQWFVLAVDEPDSDRQGLFHRKAHEIAVAGFDGDAFFDFGNLHVQRKVQGIDFVFRCVISRYRRHHQMAVRVGRADQVVFVTYRNGRYPVSRDENERILHHVCGKDRLVHHDKGTAHFSPCRIVVVGAIKSATHLHPVVSPGQVGLPVVGAG